jgi:hypothetical protein
MPQANAAIDPYQPLDIVPKDSQQIIIHPMNVEACLSYMIIEAESVDGPIFSGVDKWAPVPEDSAFRSLRNDPPVPEEHYALVLREPGDNGFTYRISNPVFAVGPYIENSDVISWAPMPLAPDHDVFEAARDL